MSLIDPLVGTSVTYLAAEKSLSANTLASYKYDLEKHRTYLRKIGRTELAQVTEQDVSELLAYLARGDKSEGRSALTPTSVTRSLSAVRNFHKFTVDESALDVDVAKRVTPPERPSRYPRTFSIDGVIRLIESIPGDGTAVTTDLCNRALVEFLYSTGTRVSEVAGLDIDDVDRETNLVLLRGRGGKERIVPVGSPATATLDAWLTRGWPSWMQANSGPALFISSLGRRLSRQSAGNTLAELGEHAGLRVEVSLHTLRHSFGTHLIEGRADVRMVQELLKHTSVTTTQIYTMITAENIRRVWARAHPRAECLR